MNTYATDVDYTLQFKPKNYIEDGSLITVTVPSQIGINNRGYTEANIYVTIANGDETLIGGVLIPEPDQVIYLGNEPLSSTAV